MKVIKKINFSLFLLISLSYLFIIISPKIIKGFYPFGIKTAIVLTGSMEPTLETNDFVIMKKPNEIKVNDIVSYKAIDRDVEVLHRVIRINNNKIVTKGDANNTEDKAIDISQITGVYVGKIKYLGNIIFFIKKPIIFSIVITIFLIIMLIPSQETPVNMDTTNRLNENSKSREPKPSEDQQKTKINDKTKEAVVNRENNNLKYNKSIANKAENIIQKTSKQVTKKTNSMAKTGVKKNNVSKSNLKKTNTSRSNIKKTSNTKFNTQKKMK